MLLSAEPRIPNADSAISETSEELVAGKLRRFKVEQGVTLVPGYFRDSLRNAPNPDSRLFTSIVTPMILTRSACAFSIRG